jgi:hypothetical protein
MPIGKNKKWVNRKTGQPFKMGGVNYTPQEVVDIAAALTSMHVDVPIKVFDAEGKFVPDKRTQLSFVPCVLTINGAMADHPNLTPHALSDNPSLPMSSFVIVCLPFGCVRSRYRIRYKASKKSPTRTYVSRTWMVPQYATARTLPEFLRDVAVWNETRPIRNDAWKQAADAYPGRRQYTARRMMYRKLLFNSEVFQKFLRGSGPIATQVQQQLAEAGNTNPEVPHVAVPETPADVDAAAHAAVPAASIANPLDLLRGSQQTDEGSRLPPIAQVPDVPITLSRSLQRRLDDTPVSLQSVKAPSARFATPLRRQTQQQEQQERKRQGVIRTSRAKKGSEAL